MDYEKVTMLMKKLPLKTQEIISLRVFQDMPFTEISKVI
jgi:DNA-directed RNA polymerase specialized sigma subunit